MYKSLSAVAVVVSVALTAAGEATAPAGAAIPSARFYDGVGDEVRSLVAGNVLTLELTLPRESDEPTAYRLVLLPEEVEVAVCDLPVAAASCRTGDIDTLGWAWSVTGERLPTRHLELWKAGEVLARFELDVTPRPVVLVHGFTATAATWNSYGGPDGFLADLGVEAYAVGDPSLGPTLNMGRTTDPTAVTNTVAENAAVLGAVIDAVRARTRADMVDVVAHSMGGLVARYYLSRLMEARSVGQLLLIGTPNLGSPCAVLPSALGFYLPAALELRPSYLEAVFNPQVFDTSGVPVEALAGTPITERFRSPCTDVPSDLVVDRTSAAGAGGSLTEVPVLHTDLTRSREVFEDFVAPRLRSTPSAHAAVPGADSTPAASQSTHVYSGSVAAGDAVILAIDLDAVAVAAFALFDPSRSLSVVVHGASGARVELTPSATGFFTLDDPNSLVQLGYGFENPRPGPWQVTLHGGVNTPAAGAPFAFTARVVGGATLTATVDEFLPTVGEAVTITAVSHDIAMDVSDAVAVVTGPTGSSRSQTMRRVGDTWLVDWQPRGTGVHGIDVIVTGTSAGGLALERTVALAVEVRDRSAVPLWLIAAGVGILACVGIVTLPRVLRRRLTPGRTS